MGQVAAIYQGKTYKLLRALSLMEKDYLTPQEAEALIEGGRLCATQGVELLAQNDENGDAGRVLDALLATSRNLLGKARHHLPAAGVHSPLAHDLAEKMRRAEKDSHRLAQWTQHHGQRPAYLC
jgi:hypothetical protein